MVIKNKCKCVLTPTEKAIDNGIIKNLYDNTLFIADRKKLGNKIFEAGVLSSQYIGVYQPQHLNVISDEDVKEYDWVLKPDGTVLKIFGNDYIAYLESNSNATKKIIASNNPELTTFKGAGIYFPIPTISESFIEFYCEKGGVDEVYVEYIQECLKPPFGDCSNYFEKDYKCDNSCLKHNVSDNTISIFVKKDNLDTEQLIREWANYTCTGRGQFWKPKDLDVWIDEKLYLKY